MYSRFQLLVFGGVCAALVLLATSLLGWLSWPWTSQSPQNKRDRRQVLIQGATIQYTEDLAALDDERYSRDEKENILIYKNLNDGVVNITSITFSYNWFLEPTPEEGTGSGSIITEDGYVLTNYHVIKDAEKLTITLADGTNFEGFVAGVDPENDLAVVKFDPEGHPVTTVALGTSTGLEVGQKVLAIGNPFALERTLTTGIVSGLGRPVRTNEGIVIKEMIQTDASINPGNSGGPLLNARGEMIGINTMIYSPSGGSVGIGFAVPVDTARRVIPDLINFGEVKRGWIEVVPVQLFPQLVRYADLPVSRGILVSEVVEGGNADAAGIKGGSPRRAVRAGRNVIYLGGDIIIEVDGTTINSLGDLYSALEDNAPGETIRVKVMRGRQEREIDVVLSERS
jgi:S1-C subfamily serine protease